jgi:hypothetical protein
MPIQFENTFVNPNIQVKGTEIPLEQLEKTSNILQDRYDKSYENLTKFQEMARQAEQSAAEEERPKVQQWLAGFEPQVNQMIQDDALHRVGWKTMAMANNAAANLKTFQERAAQIKDIKDKIATSEKLGKEETKQYYTDLLNETISQTQFDPTKNTFGFKQITAPKIVADADVNESYRKYATGWAANKTGREQSSMSFVRKGETIPGVGGAAIADGVYDIKTGQIIEKVDKAEVLNGIKAMMEQDIPVQAMIQRDTDIFMKSHPNADRNKVYQKVKDNTLNAAANAWADKASYISNIQSEDVKFNDSLTNNYLSGYGAQDLQNPFGLLSMPNDILTDTQLKDIQKETKDNQAMFDSKGNFVGGSVNKGGVVGAPAYVSNNNANNTSSTKVDGFNQLVPTYYQNVHKGSNLTQQQLYNQFQKEKENNAKILTKDYVISGTGLRGTVTNNMKALLASTDLFIKNSDGTVRKATQEEVDNAMKGNTTFNPLTGKVAVGTNAENQVFTALGSIPNAEGNQNNYTQITMAAMQSVLTDLLDLNKGTSTTSNAQVPITDPTTGELVGYRRFFANKKGAMSNTVKEVNGKKVIVPSDPAITVVETDVNGNPLPENRGKKATKVYRLGDEMNPNQFVEDMLTDVIAPFSQK